MIKKYNNLKQLRQEHGYSVSQLAQKLGVQRRAIFAWESGKDKPNGDHEKNLCKIYNIKDITVYYNSLTK